MKKYRYIVLSLLLWVTCSISAQEVLTGTVMDKVFNEPLMGANIYKNKKPIIFFLLPAFGFMLVFLYYPFVQNIINSFQNITGLGAAATGWNDPWYTNYVEMFKDPNMWTAFKNTLFMTIATVVGQVGIALVLALLVNNIKTGAVFYRIVFFFPIVVSATALGLLFNFIFQIGRAHV